MNKLLFTTMLKFVMWDKKPYILHEGDLSLGTAHYNGITWNDQGTVFVSANVDTKYIIHKFNKSFELYETLSGADLHETHQIFWRDNKLYVTNTGLNRIEILSNGKWHHVAWNKFSHDVDHINGIWFVDDKFYVSEFRNRGNPKDTSRIKVCDKYFTILDEIIIGNGIHNVYRENNTLYTLVSKTPSLVRINLKTKKRSDVFLKNVEKALIRGLARTEDYWYIGVSRWETERDKRHVGNAVILKLDNDFKEIDRVTLPDFGPICDIRVIDEPDLAHNGISCDFN